MIHEFTDAELFTMFNVDCGELVDATNDQVDDNLRIEGEELEALRGKDLWDVRFVRHGKVVDPTAMSYEDLKREQKRERRERIQQLEAMANDLDRWEAEDISICDLLPPPKYTTKTILED